MRAFWPAWTILLASDAAGRLGLLAMLPPDYLLPLIPAVLVAFIAALWFGFRALRWPSEAEALDRLDAALPGRPIQAVMDHQAIGAADPASARVWAAHQARMAERAQSARAPAPNLRVSDRDPFALRYAALLAFMVAALFGTANRMDAVSGVLPGDGSGLASGPVWEGWMEPPAYTRLPAIYLNDIDGGELLVPEGARITLRLYGAVGALTVAETVSGRPPAAADAEGDPAAEPAQTFAVTRSGAIAVEGPGGRGWDVVMIPDTAPELMVPGPAEASRRGEMTLTFEAEDDYGVTGGEARITLDLAAVDRRYGLSVDPEPVAPLVVPLPVPFAGDRRSFEETLIEDFSKHPWANLPVRIELVALDAAGQEGVAEPLAQPLPARRFFDPMAAAVAEVRRDLLWSRDNGPRVAQVLRAVSHRPEGLFRKETAYLKLRVILRRLETFNRFGMKEAQRDEIAEALWDLALLLEEGDLGDAMERMRRAQERLSEAMKNGASDQEIAELMQELREATEDYMRQLSREAMERGEDGQQQRQQQGDMIELSQDDLQRMMDRIQELMEQGRMAEAEQALREFQEMMENMQVTRNQNGEGQSEGQQRMEDLAETLRNQQGLSDEAFRDFQEQANPGARAGENQGNTGRDGGAGRGQQHGEGLQGQQGEGGGDQQDGESGSASRGTLSDRQEALRRELERQRDGLPGEGTEEGDAARRSLEQADRAMDGAAQALREGDLPEAIDRQAEAMEALREGIRNLGEAMAQQQNQGQQGNSESNQNAQRLDPLGRNPGSQGNMGTDEELLQGEDVYRRARELLDEIRRRTGDGERPDLELEYLERLLDRF